MGYACRAASQMIRRPSVLSETGRDDDDSRDYAIQTADDGTVPTDRPAK